MDEKLIYPPFFQGYISRVDTERNVSEMLEEGMRTIMIMFKFISPEKANYAYSPDKWTVKQLFGHMIDTERIMAYRALALSRGEEFPLPGFDENKYVENSNFHQQQIGEMLEHYKMVRYGNILLYKSFSEDMLNRRGIVNGNEINVRALTYITVGHELHHLSILKERYGLK